MGNWAFVWALVRLKKVSRVSTNIRGVKLLHKQIVTQETGSGMSFKSLLSKRFHGVNFLGYVPLESLESIVPHILSPVMNQVL